MPKRKRDSEDIGGGNARKRRGVSNPTRNTSSKPRRSDSMSSLELKGVDTALNDTDVLDTTNTNGSIIAVNLIAPGTGSYNRVGRKIKMKSLRIFGTALCEYGLQATTNNFLGSSMRILVVYDRQPSGTLPTFATICGHTDQAGNEASGVLDPIRYDNMSRFKILRDVKLDCHPAINPSTGGSENVVQAPFTFDEFIDLRGLETVYSGQSATCTIADVSSGALYVIYRATRNVALTAEWEVFTTSFARLRYHDQ